MSRVETIGDATLYLGDCMDRASLQPAPAIRHPSHGQAGTDGDFMTRTHCALKLLEHGPLTKQEFRQITGWSPYACMKTLGWLQERGLVEWDGSWRLI